MARHRVIKGDLAVGQPLPWDVYGKEGKLLLRRGHLIENDHQLDRLVDDGLFVDSEEKNFHELPSLSLESHHPSALKAILEARSLCSLIAHRHKADDFSFLNKIEPCIDQVITACDINQDVAIASILLHQEASYAIRHQVDAAVISLAVARAAGLSAQECRSIVAAALTMNLSMIDIQDKLDQINGDLVPSMRQALHEHPRKSAETLRAMGVTDELWLSIVLQHHERADGNGYAEGLAGEQITTGARLLALADRYCSRITHHAARPWRLPSIAMKEIFNDRGSYADDELTSLFIKTLGIYPPGTMVRIADGEIGIVTHSLGRASNPIIHAVLGLRGTALTMPLARNTSRADHQIQEAVDPRKVNVKVQMFALWGKDASEN